MPTPGRAEATPGRRGRGSAGPGGADARPRSAAAAGPTRAGPAADIAASATDWPAGRPPNQARSTSSFDDPRSPEGGPHRAGRTERWSLYERAVTVSVSRPLRRRVPGRSSANVEPVTASTPLTSTCSMPSASA